MRQCLYGETFRGRGGGHSWCWHIRSSCHGIIAVHDLNMTIVTLMLCVIFAMMYYFTQSDLENKRVAKWAVRPVEQAWKEQKQFVADASHELKTPLTVITTNAELMQQRGLDEESWERLSGNVLSMARHMRTMLEQMLELAKGDASGPPASTG